MITCTGGVPAITNPWGYNLNVYLLHSMEVLLYEKSIDVANNNCHEVGVIRSLKCCTINPTESLIFILRYSFTIPVSRLIGFSNQVLTTESIGCIIGLKMRGLLLKQSLLGNSRLIEAQSISIHQPLNRYLEPLFWMFHHTNPLLILLLCQ